MQLDFNQPFIYPRGKERPKYVEEKLFEFNSQLKKDVDKGLPLNDLRNLMVKNIEKNILYKGIYITEVLNKRTIGNLIDKMDKKISNEIEFMWYYYLLMQAGFIISSVIPASFTPEALTLPDEFIEEKDNLIEEFNKSEKTNEDAIRLQGNLSKIAKRVQQYFVDNDIHVADLLKDQGAAKGGVEHIQSLLLSVGLSINSFGEINDVIDRAHVDGITQTQFFNGSSQGIQALYAKSSSTAKPGYLGRKLATIIERVKLSNQENCRTEEYLNIKVRDQKMLDSLSGQYYKSKVGLELKLSSSDESLIGKKINLRAPMFCKAVDGICHRCYNEDFIKDMKFTAGANIGLIAATGITSTLVSLTLKKSHVGVSLDEQGLDLREEIKNMF